MMQGFKRIALGLTVICATSLVAVPPSVASAHRRTSHPASLWRASTGVTASGLATASADIQPRRFRSFTLDRRGMLSALNVAPAESFAPQTSRPLVLAVPAPRRGFQRFAVQESPVMMPALARRHPHIKTYIGRGITDPTATARFAMTPLGFNASIRGKHGSWYIDTANHLSQSLYLSYFGRDLKDIHGSFVERASRSERRAMDRALPDTPRADPFTNYSVGPQLRNHRLALMSDHTYADYWGAANVTTGKVLLVNRLNEVYEQELGIHFDLSANTDASNLNTTALESGTNGPCGASACFAATDFENCNWGTGSRRAFGLVVGADNYDIGHMISGIDGGGVSSLGVVGKANKSYGCTGLPDPVGDEFVVGYVAHEMGHQYNADHTWDATGDSCTSDQFARTDAVEPGSGSTIMSYAGICGNDNIQDYSDPYFSEKSFEDITTYVGSNPTSTSEIQTAALTGFDGTDSFKVRYNGNDSATITNGTNFTSAGIQSAIQGIAGWPSGATVTVAGFTGSGSPSASGFQVTFGGTLANSAASVLQIVNANGFTGKVGVVVKGGPSANGGTISNSGNHAPVVSVPSSYTIPYRTPFSLTGSSTDADNDTVTYSWEQNDAPPSGTSARVLRSASKPSGPLFRMFGSAPSGTYCTTCTPSGGVNATTTNPTRVFPDMAQIAAGNTDAESGTCAANDVECWAEFLPTSVYAGPMHFRLTARDGHAGAGGIASADTTVNLASGTGPFLVTAPNTNVSWNGNTPNTVTWNVAGTSSAPISASNVSITLSTNGGLTYPVTLAASTPNDGSEGVTVPNSITTTQARIKVQAVGNVFFDISNANFSIAPSSNQQTITFGPLSDKTYGDADFGVSATASSGLTVTFGATGTCTVTGSTVHLTGGGSCTIAANQAGDGFWQPAPEVDQTFTVNPMNQTISFGALANRLLSDPDFDVSATATSGLAVAFSASGPCTVSGATVHLTAAGSCSITAQQAGNADYNAAPDVVRSFSIAKGNQTITFPALADHAFGDTDFPAGASASSGLTVTYLASGQCSVPGSMVHLLAAGSCTITARQTGDPNWNAAPNVVRTFNIAKGNQTITFGALPNKTFGDPDFAVSASASSMLTVAFAASGACTVSGTTVHLTGAGSCTITATQAGNTDWNAAPDVPRSFSIAGGGTPTTTVLALSKTTVPRGNNVKFTATVKVTSGPKPKGTAEFLIDGVSIGSGSLNAKAKFALTVAIDQSVGTHSVVAKYHGNGSFAPSTSPAKNLKVT